MQQQQQQEQQPQMQQQSQMQQQQQHGYQKELQQEQQSHQQQQQKYYKPSEAGHLISQKHDLYNARCNRYRLVYYSTRLTAGLSAGLLPFFVGANPTVATPLSICTLICIVIDQVFNPKEKWILYSKATDLLMIAKLKAKGEYQKSKESLKILQEVEEKSLGQLSGLSELLEKLRKER